MTAPSPHLVFSQPHLAGSPTRLVFGETDAAVLAPVTATISVTLSGGVAVTALAATPIRADAYVLLSDGVTAAALAAVPIRASAYALLSGVVAVEASAGYDHRVTRWRGQPVAVRHQVAVARRAECALAWRVSEPRRDAVALGWQIARASAAVRAMPWQAAAPRQQAVAARWALAMPQHRLAAVVHQAAIAHEVRCSTGWQVADSRSVQAALSLQAGILRQVDRAATWQTAQPLALTLTARLGASLRLRGTLFMGLPWQQAMTARNGRSVLPIVVPPVLRPHDGHLLFQCPPLAGSPVRLVFGAQPCYLLPAARVVVPFLRTYVTINSITLRRVSDSAPLTAYGFTMSLDWQSWTWAWSASIPADQLALLQPGYGGDPVEVEALVNGVPYRLCAEGLDRQRQFSKGRVNIQGRGTAAILDEPYAPVLNFGNAGARTAQQLMADVLSINGVGIGWSVDWNLTDWLVPSGAWTHQGAYISAILDIAGAAGGYVQPHDTAQTLRILSKYPVAPWDWAGVTPDFELPGIATVEGISWQRKADYNRIYVSGVSAGVLGQVTRAGTAGDSVAPMVTHSLITHADAARQRGLAELAGAASQASVSLKLPVLAETGLILPGKFVRYGNGSETHLGLVRGISMDWSRPVLRQTLSVETHV